MSLEEHSQDIIYGICRFNNIGNVSCYMNSILAVIQQTPILIDYILTAEFKDIFIEKYKKDNEIDTAKIIESILFQLYNIMKISHTYNNRIITPTSFRKSLTLKDSMWGMQQHQDSQEFLSFLLNNIEEEIAQKVIFIPGRTADVIEKNAYNKPIFSLLNIMANNIWQQFIKKEYSIIKNLFGGMTYNNTTCEYCKNNSHNFDIFQTLQLSIPHNRTSTLDECMEEYIKVETVDKDNKIICDFCGRKNKANKQTLLWKTPKVLIIQLKRFRTNDYGIISQKISNMVEYPINNLDISKYIHPESPYIDKNIYNLYAVNNHHSIGNIRTINFGHYTTMVINKYDNKWYEFDDSNELNEITDKDDIINKNAYLLFYYRCN
jgi:ubiquitin C-terminal hydrolase